MPLPPSMLSLPPPPRKTSSNSLGLLGRSRPVKLSIDRNHLLLSASSAEQGQAQEELDADVVQYESSPLEIGFQARYLNDITDQIADQVEFRFADGSAPTVVTDSAKP
jgi:DNA polymerase-3 subunit beta